MSNGEYRTSDLMNYNRQGSNSNNYGATNISSSPDSFPYIMENGILVEYKTLNFSSEITPEHKEIDNPDKNDQELK